MSRTVIIAEAGSCHDGVYEKAVGLIDVARDAGADVVKFQFWSDAKRLAERRNADKYLPIYEQYAMPASWLPRLHAETNRRGLEFMCTVYLPEDIPTVAPFVRRFKVASFEASDHTFVTAHLPFDKPILVSTGMSPQVVPLASVQKLHCVSAYPTPLDEANLGVLFGDDYVGFSDHTHCIYTGAFAVCAGASVIEVHIKDWATARDNPDAETALDPTMFAEYVRLVRLAERMLGDGHKHLMPCEVPMTRYQVNA